MRPSSLLIEVMRGPYAANTTRGIFSKPRKATILITAAKQQSIARKARALDRLTKPSLFAHGNHVGSQSVAARRTTEALI